MQMWEGKKYFQLSLWKGSEAKQKVGFPITPQKIFIQRNFVFKNLGYFGSLLN